MNLLVGATGFVGGHVVEYLFQQGEISKATFRKGSYLKNLDSHGVQGVEADLLDHHSLHEAMDGVDVIYSMASPMPGADSEFMKINTEGVRNLLEVAAESKVKAFVHLSTLDVYGFRSRLVDVSTLFSPSDEYQRSKAEAERLLKEFSSRNDQPKVVILRAARALGSRDESLVLPVLRMLSSGKVVIPSNGTMSFSHPHDLARAMFLAATADIPTGKAFLVKSFDSTPIEVAAGIARATGSRSEIERQGVFFSSTLPKYTANQLKASTRMADQRDWMELGYAPEYGLKETCEEIAAWFKKEPWIIEGA